MEGAPTGGVETRVVVGESVGLVVSVLSGLLSLAFFLAAQYGFHEAEAG